MDDDRAAAERVAESIAMSIYEAATLEAGFPLDQRIYDDAVDAITTALLTWGAQRWREGVEEVVVLIEQTPADRLARTRLEARVRALLGERA